MHTFTSRSCVAQRVYTWHRHATVPHRRARLLRLLCGTIFPSRRTERSQRVLVEPKHLLN